jgi:hypothetical protein
MNYLAKIVLFIWVVVSLLAAAMSGLLITLVAMVILALLVRHWSEVSLTNRYTCAHQQEIAILSQRILRIRMNAAQAKEAHDLARTLLPRNPTPAQLSVLERTRGDMYKPENNLLIADQLQAHLDGLVKGGLGAELPDQIRLSANLLGLGTFFVPLVPVFILGMDLWQNRRNQAAL